MTLYAFNHHVRTYFGTHFLYAFICSVYSLKAVYVLYAIYFNPLPVKQTSIKKTKMSAI